MTLGAQRSVPGHSVKGEIAHHLYLVELYHSFHFSINYNGDALSRFPLFQQFPYKIDFSGRKMTIKMVLHVDPPYKSFTSKCRGALVIYDLDKAIKTIRTLKMYGF